MEGRRRSIAACLHHHIHCLPTCARLRRLPAYLRRAGCRQGLALPFLLPASALLPFLLTWFLPRHRRLLLLASCHVLSRLYAGTSHSAAFCHRPATTLQTPFCCLYTMVTPLHVCTHSCLLAYLPERKKKKEENESHCLRTLPHTHTTEKEKREAAAH